MTRIDEAYESFGRSGQFNLSCDESVVTGNNIKWRLGHRDIFVRLLRHPGLGDARQRKVRYSKWLAAPIRALTCINDDPVRFITLPPLHILLTLKIKRVLVYLPWSITFDCWKEAHLLSLPYNPVWEGKLQSRPANKFIDKHR